MESLEELKKYWEENKNKEIQPDPPGIGSVEQLIKARVRRERNIVMEYFWASFVYQIFVYAFASHLIINYRGDGEILLWSLSVVVLYIPFTVIVMRKFKAMCLPAINGSIRSGQSIRTTVENQYTRLSEFFRFKKIADWIGIPLSCFILVKIVFKLYVMGGMEEHLVGGILSYAAVLIAFITTTYFENRKRFINPLRRLEGVLKDLNETR
jgi:hypothetical protein